MLYLWTRGTAPVSLSGWVAADLVTHRTGAGVAWCFLWLRSLWRVSVGCGVRGFGADCRDDRVSVGG